jgi:hypothetical protein
MNIGGMNVGKHLCPSCRCDEDEPVDHGSPPLTWLDDKPQTEVVKSVRSCTACVIDSDDDFQEQTSKFHDREDVPGGEVRCMACGYKTTNETWPSGEPSDEPPTDYIHGILLNDGRFLCGECHQMTEGPAHPCARPCEALEESDDELFQRGFDRGRKLRQAEPLDPRNPIGE